MFVRGGAARGSGEGVSVVVVVIGAVIEIKTLDHEGLQSSC